MEKILFLSKVDGEFKQVELQTFAITSFGIACSRTYRKKGGFRKWIKGGYIISDSVRYVCGNSYITELKKHFKGHITSEKHTLSEMKYSTHGHFVGERKATNWNYKIK